MLIKAVDGEMVEVAYRKLFRVGDALLRVRRIKTWEPVASRAGGETPTIVCTLEGGIPPPFMSELKVGTDVPFPGDLVAALVRDHEKKAKGG